MMMMIMMMRSFTNLLHLCLLLAVFPNWPQDNPSDWITGACGLRCIGSLHVICGLSRFLLHLRIPTEYLTENTWRFLLTIWHSSAAFASPDMEQQTKDLAPFSSTRSHWSSYRPMNAEAAMPRTPVNKGQQFGCWLCRRPSHTGIPKSWFWIAVKDA